MQAKKQSFDRALTFLKNGEANLAEQICRGALVDDPKDPNFLCLSARALHLLGRHGDAEERLLGCIALYPQLAKPHVIHGEILLTQGRFDQAVQAFQRAIDFGDEDSDTRLKLARASLLRGDRQTAESAVGELMRLDPTRERLAGAYELELGGKPAEAEKIYREILHREPHNVDAMRLLASIATSQKQHRDAEILLRRVIELAPDFGRAMADLVINLIEQEKLEDALAFASRLARIGPDNPDTFLLLGNAHSAAGHYDDAIEAYRKTLRLSARHPGALSGLAHNLRTLGRRDEAIQAYRLCMQTNPMYSETYWSLANLKTFRFTDDEVSAMEELLQHPNIPDSAQIHLCNALGLEYEGRRDYDRAYSYFERCNLLRRAMEYYDAVETEALHDKIIEVFNQDLLLQSRPETAGGIRPIFIVGLPRSGSTLLEQILASHSQVEGTHELSDLARIVKEMPAVLKVQARYPDLLKELAPEAYRRPGEAYLERTAKYRIGKPCFTDKNPNNFAHVGLIHLALPEAIIIDAQRHPLDSCLGSYKQLFASGQSWSYNLTEVAEFYAEYRRLMDHWDLMLPGKVLHVRYEDVVTDLETQVKRLLEHCGLSFEAQCLNFHDTERAVKTASSEQVRRPIYRSSVNLWRNYERHLGPAIEVLEELLVKLPRNDRPETFGQSA